MQLIKIIVYNHTRAYTYTNKKITVLLSSLSIV